MGPFPHDAPPATISESNPMGTDGMEFVEYAHPQPQKLKALFATMGFTEVASDDGVISGRGSPIKRGLTTGIMTTVGGLGHALPYLIPHFWTATWIAIAVVFVELWAIVWVQNRFMETPWGRAIFQVVLGGALVFAAGMLIGNA